MPSILFVHEYFPAQFGGLARYLAGVGWNVVFATAREEYGLAKTDDIENFKVLRYRGGRMSINRHPYLTNTERAVRNGQSFLRLADSLHQGGFKPDGIVTHSAWGSGLFAKSVWPDAKLVQYLEWWVNDPAPHHTASDIQDAPRDALAQNLMGNLPFLLDFQQSDLVLAPTKFQADQAPEFVQPRIVVQHDGVECDTFRPLAEDEAPFPIKGVPDDAPILTFAARSLEPIRGFYDFMAAAEQLMVQRPDLHIVVAGEDRARYASKLKRGLGHRRTMLVRHKFDRKRLHFLGRIPKGDYMRLLRRSSVHAYLSRPFVLSWSLVEAMASACPLVVTNIPPVREALGATEPALMVEPGDVEQIVASVNTLLDHPDHAQAMGAEARERAQAAFDTTVCYPRIAQVFEDLLKRAPLGAIAAQ
ncbi:MAG: glycosyltransferase [Pseudomonadota bacterium]